MFKTCYALEKIHGTNCKITWDGKELVFFSGGEKHENFVALFNKEEIKSILLNKGLIEGHFVTIYGEAYGGKQQGMSETYGKQLKFIVFDVKIDHSWLSVPDAENFAKSLNMEFVHYVKIPTDLDKIDAERDADSTQAIRNGVGNGKKREGIVLRPPIELIKNNGDRVICKHKRDEFMETKHPRKVVDITKQKILDDAEKVADEWVTLNRLKNILSHWKEEDISIENTGKIIKEMVEDITREASGEIGEFSKDINKAISKKCALLFKDYFKLKLQQFNKNMN